MPKVYRRDKEPRMWLMPVANEVNDYLARDKFIDRVLPRTFKFMEGDEVFVYLKYPVSKVLYRLEVVKTDFPFAEVGKSAQLWEVKNFSAENAEKFRAFRMELREYFDPQDFGDRLTIDTLKERGLLASMIFSVTGEKREILRQLVTLPKKPKPRPVRLISDLFREERERANAHIRALRKTPMGKTLNTLNIMVVWKDGKVVQNKSANTTFFETVYRLGYNEVANSGVLFGGKYPVCTRRPETQTYSEHTAGWYILDRIANTKKALLLNELAEKLNVCLYAQLIDKG